LLVADEDDADVIVDPDPTEDIEDIDVAELARCALRRGIPTPASFCRGAVGKASAGGPGIRGRGGFVTFSEEGVVEALFGWCGSFGHSLSCNDEVCWFS